MSYPEDRGQMRIGEVLKRSRTRQGIEIAEVEERTKIRTKYLRALENEDWDVLPSPAYAKGFLRTYAQLLGLDADAIVDEYRRQVESELPDGHPLRLGEPVLEARRRPGGGQRSWSLGWLVAGGIVAAVAVLLLIGVVGGDDEGKPADVKTAKEQRKERKQARKKSKQEQSPSPSTGAKTVTLTMSMSQDVQICLIGAGGKVLIPGQVLSAGTEDSFEQPRFDLRFPSGYDVGQFTLTLNGDRTRLPETTGPAAFEIKPGAKPKPGPAPGAECP